MSTIARWLKVSRAPFLTASALPVLVGTSLAWAATDHLKSDIFAWALFGILFIHAGANLVNEYFDHVLGADVLNPHRSPLFGGSGMIQRKSVSARSVLIAAILCLAIGAAFGFRVHRLTHRDAVIAFGIIGIVGAWFYTSPPLKLAYRTLGEAAVVVLFGVLPVWASYYIQTRTFDLVPIIPSCITGFLIFNVILANEFPDAPTDAAAGKQTIIVRFGPKAGCVIYVVAVVAVYAIAFIAPCFQPKLQDAWTLLIWSIPLAICAIVFLYIDIVKNKGSDTFNFLTIALHGIACLLMTAGFMLRGWSRDGHG